MQREIKKRAQLYALAAVLLAITISTLCYNLGALPTSLIGWREEPKFLKAFKTYEEIRNFIIEKSSNPPIIVWSNFEAYQLRVNVEYSTTNIQVAGVDEDDIVKTDGEHIYAIANNTVFILKAYPPKEARILSKITFKENINPVGIFISSNGGKIAVLGSKYYGLIPRFTPYYAENIFTTIYVYDISDKTKPTLERNFTITGRYFGSRMVDEYIYVVVGQPAYLIYDTVILPKVYKDREIREIRPEQIYHFPNASDRSYIFTSIAAINIVNRREEPNVLTFIMGETGSLYASKKNLYITFHDKPNQTSILKVRIDRNQLKFEAKGTVFGTVINQFSMDEYEGYFRIATTIWKNGETWNNIYVLDEKMNIIGNLTNIAIGEAIDSARFMGDRCYLATSVAWRDPFFVIDLKDPKAPKVLGYLKIPGFTRYLHPYDENYVIGIGRDENNNLRISIFDVSNTANPIEVSSYVIKGEWVDTLVLSDHKAFLFDKQKEIMAMPISIIDGLRWQGAYIFRITSDHRISLNGRVSHQEESSRQDPLKWVKRALYIDDVIYTISEAKVRMNKLWDITLVGEINFA